MAVDRIGGLARPMPRFAILMALLTMAAVGLPPFGFFSGYVGILLRPSGRDLMGAKHHRVHLVCGIILPIQTDATASSLARTRADIPYRGSHTEVRASALLIVLLMLVIIGLLPYGFFEFDPLAISTTMEMTTSWLK